MFGHYLLFGGDCAAALEVYARAFGGTVTELRRYGDVPSPGFDVADEHRQWVLNARLVWDGSELMAADSVDRRAPGTNMYVSVATPDEALVRRAWTALSQDGTVYMALAPTFFAAAHGSLRDRFGVNWMFTALRPR